MGSCSVNGCLAKHHRHWRVPRRWRHRCESFIRHFPYGLSLKPIQAHNDHGCRRGTLQCPPLQNKKAAAPSPNTYGCRQPKDARRRRCGNVETDASLTVETTNTKRMSAHFHKKPEKHRRRPGECGRRPQRRLRATVLVRRFSALLRCGRNTCFLHRLC